MIGVWFGLAGGLAVLVALAARHRAWRLRRHGVMVWGTAVPGPDRTVIRYAMPDGACLEHATRQPLRRSRAFLPGQEVLVWYDPSDPRESLVFGGDGRTSDRVLLTVGLVVLAAGVVLALGS